MGKLYWFKFEPGSWLKDPELRSVSSGARGLWIDMLSLMFESVRRGYLKLNNGNIVTAELLARMTGNSTDDTSRWLQELEYSGVLSRTDDGCIFNRRMVREQTERTKNGERVTRHRKTQHVTPDVTGYVTDVSNSNSDLPDFVFEVLKNYPNTKHRTKTTHIEEYAIVEAVARDGEELVMAGVRNYAAAVASWPKAESKFALGLVKFMQTQEYLADPQKWDRRSRSEIAVDQFLKGEPNDSGKALEDFVRRGDPVVSANAKRSGV